ncbi:hypothetical protein DPMN_144048 [Dreissena polymorpha]|uniref:Uncharacterized protein n=1 Tax=Dreissena polymorpha TaxID=45954 RepID=A0A9D4GDY2_DREPO|nr:hypothetical protein DPMN_144048 [Dreissena polymorpha]
MCYSETSPPVIVHGDNLKRFHGDSNLHIPQEHNETTEVQQPNLRDFIPNNTETNNRTFAQNGDKHSTKNETVLHDIIRGNQLNTDAHRTDGLTDRRGADHYITGQFVQEDQLDQSERSPEVERARNFHAENGAKDSSGARVFHAEKARKQFSTPL